MKPMLAMDYDGRDPRGWWVSEKLDGVRALWTGSGLVTRNGNAIAAPGWFTDGFPAFPLDGELWAGRGSFQTAVGIVRRKVPVDADWRRLGFFVFDAPAAVGSFERRMQLLAEWHSVSRPTYCSVLAQRRCLGRADADWELSRIVAAGGEGLMLRAPGSPYVQGRSDLLLKLKPISDADGVVVGYEPGRGRNANRVGALLVRLDDGGEFALGTGLSDDDRAAPPAIGCRVKFQFSGRTDAGLPRCASFEGVRE